MRLPQDEPARSQRLSIYEGLLAVPFINWSTGMVTTGYALWMGADPLSLAILGVLPMATQLVSPFGLFFRGSRKHLGTMLATVGRLVFSLALFLPLLEKQYQVPGLVIISLISQLIQAPNGLLWTSWMADLVPEKERGKYFGFRNGLLGLEGTLGNLMAGAFIDHVGKPWGILWVLFIGSIVGVLAVVVLRMQYEPPYVQPAIQFRDFFVPLRDRNFRGYLGFVVFFMGAVMIGGPFMVPIWLEYTKFSFAQVGLWGVISASLGMVMSPLWGRLADRIGHMYVLLFTSIFASFLPILTLIANRQWTTPIWSSAVLDALAWGGLGTALMNQTLQASSAEKRNVYIALYSIASGLAGLIGAFIGGWLGKLHIGATPYHLPLEVSAILRFCAVGYLMWRLRREWQKRHSTE